VVVVDVELDVLVDLLALHVARRAGEDVPLARALDRLGDRAVDVDADLRLRGRELVVLALVPRDDRLVERLEHRTSQLGAGGRLLHSADGHPADRDPLGDLVLTAGVVRVDPAGRSDEKDDERRNDEEGPGAHLLKRW
jgi:hypothetical protein